MQRIWAPWRIDYILGSRKKKQPGCFLCIRKSRGYKKRHYVLAESSHSYVILNKYPYSAGHLMVVPARHVPGMDELTEKELSDFFLLVRAAVRALKKGLKPDGMNIGANLGKAAGAGAVDHLHFHIVPRWNGDHNFLPVIGGSMVMSEYLDETYTRLLCFFSNK